MTKLAIGIDIGGSGIKAAVVDLENGELYSERVKLATPEGGKPADIVAVCKTLLDTLDEDKVLSVGICFPAVVRNGVTMSAANVSDAWIGLDAAGLFSEALGTQIIVLNDADAAGVAEMAFGSGQSKSGLVIMTTLGTGIGSAIFYNQVLIPNSELGHLDIGKVENIETYASSAAMERENLTFGQWANRLSIFFEHLEKIFNPDLFIVGGGISKDHEEFLPLMNLHTPIVPAVTKNAAGIIGAALLAGNQSVGEMGRPIRRVL